MGLTWPDPLFFLDFWGWPQYILTPLAKPLTFVVPFPPFFPFSVLVLKGLGKFQYKPVCKWEFKSTETASSHWTEVGVGGTQLWVTGCGDKSGGPWACGSFDKQMAARVPWEPPAQGEKQPGWWKEGKIGTRFEPSQFGGYQLLFVLGTSLNFWVYPFHGVVVRIKG